MGTKIDNIFIQGIKDDFYKPKIIRYNNLKTKIDQINNDISFIQKFIYDLIASYHKDEIYNEAQRYTFLCKKINEIVKQKFEITKQTNNETTDREILNFKTKLLKFISQIKDIQSDDKKKIQQAICDTIQIDDKYIENKINDILSSNIESKIDNDQKISFIQNILSNPTLINAINTKLASSVFNVSPSKMRGDINHIRGLIRDFKRYNKNIFPASSNVSLATESSFTKLLKTGGKYEIVLIKYNKLVLRKLISKIHEKGTKEWKEIQHNTFMMKLRNDISSEISYLWKIKDKFKKITTLSFWKNKFHNIVLNFKEFVKKMSISGFILGGFTLTAKFISLIGRTTISVIKNGISLLWTSLKFVKNLVVLSINVVKSVITGGIGIFKKISLFLLSPPGAYITGFIIGFFKDRIINFFSSIIKVIKGIWKWFKETVETSDTYKEWKKNRDNGKTDSFERFDILKYIEQKIFTIIDNSTKKVGEYAKIVREGGTIDTIVDKLKEKLEDDTGYGDLIQKLQLTIFETFNGWNFNTIYQKFDRINDFISQMTATDGIIQKLINFSSMKVGKTKLAKKELTGAAFSTANFIIGGIAALGGPYGWLIGGGLVALNSVIKNIVLNYMSNIPLSKSDQIDLQSELREIDSKFETDDFLTKSRDETKHELDIISARLKNGTSENQQDDQEKQKILESKLSTIEDQIKYRDRKYEAEDMGKRLQNISEFILGGANPSIILEYILNDKKIEWENHEPIENLIPEHYPDNIKKQILNVFDIKKTDVKSKLEELIYEYQFEMLSKKQFEDYFIDWYNTYNSHIVLDKTLHSYKDRVQVSIGNITDTNKNNRKENKPFSSLSRLVKLNKKQQKEKDNWDPTATYVIRDGIRTWNKKPEDPISLEFIDEFNNYREKAGYLKPEETLEQKTDNIFQELLSRNHNRWLKINEVDYNKYYGIITQNENLVRGYIKQGLRNYEGDMKGFYTYLKEKIHSIINLNGEWFRFNTYEGTTTDYTSNYKSFASSVALWLNPLLPKKMQEQTEQLVKAMESGTINDEYHDKMMKHFIELNEEYNKYNYATKLTSKINEIFSNTEGYNVRVDISNNKLEEFNATSSRGE